MDFSARNFGSHTKQGGLFVACIVLLLFVDCRLKRQTICRIMPFWCEKFIVDGVKLRLALPKSHLYCSMSAAHIMAHIVACLQLLL